MFSLTRLVTGLASLGATLALAAPATAFEAKVYGATTNLRAGVALPAGATSDATLAAAGNEFESFQIVAEGPLDQLSVVPGEALTRIGGGGVIQTAAADPASQMTIYRVGMYDVTAEPGLSDREGALGAWPDALIPEVDPIYGEDRSAWPRTVTAGAFEAAWVDIHVPANQAAGTYEGTVLVKDGNAVVDTVKVTLDVRPFSLPSTSSLTNAFFTRYTQPCLAHTGAAICNDSAKLHALYARVALENRVTLANPWTLGENQGPTTEAAKAQLRQYVLPLLDGTGAGEGTRARRLRDARLTLLSQYWDCGATCLTAWRDFLADPGPAVNDDFRDRFVYYACDEPPNPCTWQIAADRLAVAQNTWPGVRRLVTTPPPRAQENGITPDVLAPVINQVDGKNCCGNAYIGNQRQTQAYRDFLDPAKNTAGTAKNELWMYTSNMSHGSDAACTVPPTNDCRDYHTNSVSPLWAGWPGYVIDQPAAQARAMGWMAFGYDASGELYWHTTYQLPNAWTSQWESGGHGDGTLFYPGTTARIGGAHDIPVESLRLKRIRDGREDYEYLLAAKRAGKGAEAQQVFHAVFGASSMMFNVTNAIGDQAFADARAQLAAYIGGTTPEPAKTCEDPNAIKGTPGDDPNLTGTAGDDVIVGLGGNDTIRGLGGDDLLCGGDGFDTLDGGPGDDRLYGEAAEYGTATSAVSVDLASGSATGMGRDELYGIVEVYGSPFADALSGAAGNEFLAGAGGDDILDGRGGRDWLKGGPGNDTLTGGAGLDQLDGEAGADTLAARDGETDLRVDCGADTDPVPTIDPTDPVTNCEAPDPVVLDPEPIVRDPDPIVRDPIVKPVDPIVVIDDPLPPPPFTCSATAPRQTLAGARRRGVTVTVRCTLRAQATLRLTTRRGKLNVSIGRAGATVKSTTLRLELDARALRQFKRARRLTTTLALSARALDGRTTTARLTVPLRR